MPAEAPAAETTNAATAHAIRMSALLKSEPAGRPGAAGALSGDAHASLYERPRVRGRGRAQTS